MEISRLRKEIEANNQAADQALASNKSKYTAMLEEAAEEVEQVKKQKMKWVILLLCSILFEVIFSAFFYFYMLCTMNCCFI